MADSASCDRCGADLLAAEVRYVAEMRVWAAYDVMEIGSRRGLDEINYRAEYKKALAAAAQQSDEEAANSVYWSRRYDLCAQCRKLLQADPLGKNGASQDQRPEKAP